MSSTAVYEIILKPYLDESVQVMPTPLQEMTTEGLQGLLAAINEEIAQREWDRKWKEALESEESIAYWEKRSQELDQEIQNGKITEWRIEEDFETLLQ